MMWKKCELISNVQNGTCDELGNILFDEIVTVNTFAREADITDKDLKLDGRVVTNKTVKLLVCLSISHFKDCDFILIENAKYSIDETEPAGRFTIVFCSRTGELQ